MKILTILLACLLALGCGASSTDGSAGDSLAGADGALEIEERPIVTIVPSDPAFAAQFDADGTEPSRLAVLNEVLITATQAATRADVEAVAVALGGEIVGNESLTRLWQLRFPNEGHDPKRLAQAIQTARRYPVVEAAFANDLLEAMTWPDDGYAWNGKSDDCACQAAWDDIDLQNQFWGQLVLNLPAAWELSTGSPVLPIAVVDEGFEVGHRDFGGAAVLKYGSSWKNAHGTKVAGILGARGDSA